MREDMILRKYKKEDAQIIAGWIRSEEELYKWSADRLNKFPLSGDDINENYAPHLETGRFFPLSALDDNGEVKGHFIIRYPRDDDDSSVRFGFVIVDPSLRGKGYGKEMLCLGIEYVKEHFSASRIDLGVFENNESARHCYESAGFKEFASRECEMPTGTWICIDMELFLKRTIEYKITSNEDMELLMDSRMEMLRAVNHLGDDYHFEDDFVRESREYFKNGDQTTILALDDGKVVGCASISYIHVMPTFSHPTGKRAHLMNVYTVSDYRRKGIAKEMVLKLIQEARNRGVTEISLDTTEMGRAFYASLGFKESKECMVL